MRTDRNRMFHSMDAEDVAKALHSHTSLGLTPGEARSRIRKYGENTLFYVKKTGVFSCVGTFVSDPSFLLCFLVSCVAICFSEWKTGLTAITILVLSVGISVFFNMKTLRRREKTAGALLPLVRVIRGGKFYQIQARYLVPGDVILLYRGDVVPADARLLRTEHLCVSTAIFEDGQIHFEVPEEKTADPLDSAEFSAAPHRANMVYGKSEITEGFGTAIVVNTGKYTYIGAIGGAEDGSDHQIPQSVRAIGRRSKWYGIGMLLAVVPLTALGIACSSETGFLNLFLLALALAVSSLGTVETIFAGLIVRETAERAGDPSRREDRALFRRASVMDDLREIREILLVGPAVLHDGKRHVTNLFVADAICPGEALSGEEADTALRAAYLFFRGYRTHLGAGNEEDSLRAYYTGMDEFLKLAGTDTESLGALTGFPVYGEGAPGSLGCVDVNTRNGPVKISAYLSEHVLEICTGIRHGRTVVPSSAYAVTAASSTAATLRQRGKDLLFFVTEEHGETVFEGFFAFAPLFSSESSSGRSVGEILSEFRGRGVGLTLILPSGDRAAQYARKIGFSGENTAGLRLVFSDAPHKEALRRLKSYRENGVRVCAVALTDADRSLLHSADAAVAFDRFSDTSGLPYCEAADREGTLESDRSSCVLKREADFLIERAGESGGGLFSLYNAYRSALSVSRRTRAMLHFLTDTQVLRMALVLLSLISGYRVIGVPLILFSGLFFDLFAVILMIHSVLPEVPRTVVPGGPLYYLVPLFTGGGLFLISMIPTLTGWEAAISGQGCYLLLSILLVQITAFLCRYRAACGRFRINPVTGGFLLMFFTAIVRCVTLAPIAEFLGIGDMNLLRCAFLPAGPVLYMVFYQTVSVIRKSIGSR